MTVGSFPTRRSSDLLVALLPLQSVAIQVRVTEVPQASALVTSLETNCTLESHVSLAVGLLKAVTGSTGHSTVVSASTPWMTGGVVSTWLTVWRLVALLPLQSVAIQVRVTEVPQASALVTSLETNCTLASQVSLAVGLL